MTETFASPRAVEPAAIAALVRHTGVLEALSVGWAVQRRLWAGEPFAHGAHSPVADEREEELSRAQIGPAIVLYRVLLERRGRAEAFAIVRDVALAAGRAFLERELRGLPVHDLQSPDEHKRRAFVERATKRFFNARFEVLEASATRVHFVARTCRFPRLCADAGAPELASIFCEVDEHTFGSVLPDIALERPTTIAKGGDSCPFTLVQLRTRKVP